MASGMTFGVSTAAGETLPAVVASSTAGATVVLRAEKMMAKSTKKSAAPAAARSFRFTLSSLSSEKPKALRLTFVFDAVASCLSSAMSSGSSMNDCSESSASDGASIPDGVSRPSPSLFTVGASKAAASSVLSFAVTCVSSSPAALGDAFSPVMSLPKPLATPRRLGFSLGAGLADCSGGSGAEVGETAAAVLEAKAACAAATPSAPPTALEASKLKDASLSMLRKDALMVSASTVCPSGNIMAPVEPCDAASQSLGS
mmetsp:Transcript_35981/g.113065  ORF Transcript_35981/g.113065 Transcript_35981/m.113065 type:complete len:258 (-) Transcript_35981:609-1382(-)